MSNHQAELQRPTVADALTLAATLTAPRMSRALIRDNLTAWGHPELVEKAEQVVSELATNAVQATADERQVIRIYMALVESVLLVGVIDHASGVPRKVEADGEHGRGLQITEALSVKWGHYDLKPSSRGKMVWAELAL